MNKHEALQNWVSPFLEENHLYFQSAEAYPNIRILVPQYGDYISHTDICGFKYRSYTFVFIGYENVDTGTSDVNIRNMELFDSLNEWLEKQKSEGNFPDFGERCSDYEIHPLQNMANVATITESGLAKYMLAARIDYKEE